MLTIGLGTCRRQRVEREYLQHRSRFLDLGDNGASVALNTAVTGTTPRSTRMARIWTTEEPGRLAACSFRMPKA